jgi:hypothetical protein
MRHIEKQDIVARQHAGSAARDRGNERQEEPQIKVCKETSQEKAGEDEEIIGSRSGIEGEQDEERVERLRLHVRCQRRPVRYIGIPERQMPFAEVLMAGQQRIRIRQPGRGAHVVAPLNGRPLAAAVEGAIGQDAGDAARSGQQCLISPDERKEAQMQYQDE